MHVGGMPATGGKIHGSAILELGPLCWEDAQVDREVDVCENPETPVALVQIKL